MRRKIDAHLDEWARSVDGSPILLRGARRVGKTFAVKRLGNEHFGADRFVYCDFQADLQRLNQVFDGPTDIERIIDSLELLSGKRIDRQKTLIAFDEVQLCEKALNSLRFFAESGYRVIATGSQLGLTLKDRTLPFPSDVQHRYLRPLDFEEFLWAVGEERMAEGIRSAFEKRGKFLLHEEALTLYHQYVTIGGMPGVVQSFVAERDFGEVRARQAEILETYTADIALYAPAVESVRVQAVWRSIPKQIARETSRKFRYADVAKGGREKQYRTPLAWLEAAELVLLVEQTNETQAPLVARDAGSFFKVYLSDVGLLYKQLELDPSVYLRDELRAALSARFRGALAENYVEQSLVANGLHPFYWVPKAGTPAEVEFVLQDGLGRVVPIEVKSGKNVSATSLKRYQEKSGALVAVRISEKNFGREGGILSVPLYATFCLNEDTLLGL